MAHLHHHHSQHSSSAPGHPQQQQQQQHHQQSLQALQQEQYQLASAGFQLDTGLELPQTDMLTNQPHALRPLQSQGQSSSPTGFHPSMDAHQVSGPGGLLTQLPTSQAPTIESQVRMQYQPPTLHHSHAPSDPSSFLEMQPHMSLHQSLQSMPNPPPPSSPVRSTHQQSHQQHHRHVQQQRQAPATLRPMPPPTTDRQGNRMVMSTLGSSGPIQGSGVGTPSNRPRVGMGSEILATSGAESQVGEVPPLTLPGNANPRPSSGQSSGRVSGGHTGITPGATSQITPVKDQDGKFPCPHCPKTYLHAKHLKRHLLRHTGDRPYQCILCKDTFSRSDILKRHFQKCSIRRGNPTGATHLSHAHAHQQGRRPNHHHPAPHPPPPPPPLPAESPISTPIAAPAEGSDRFSPESSSEGRGSTTRSCDQCVRSGARCDSGNPCERCRMRDGVECSYSGIPRRTDSRSEIGLMSMPELSDSSTLKGQPVGYGEGFNFPPPTHPHAHVAHSGQHSLSPPQRQSQTPDSQQQQSSHHAGVSQSPANPFYNSGWENLIELPEQQFLPFYLPPSTQSPSDGISTSVGGIDQSLQDSDQPVYGMYFPTDLTDMPPLGPLGGVFVGWDITQQIDPLQVKCDQLIAICFPESPGRGSSSAGSPDQRIESDSTAEDLKRWLTPDHVKHFVRLFFINFQGHFPMIHLPTFNMLTIADGLLLAMICIGAVYSDKGITAEDVRAMIDRSFAALDGTDHGLSDGSQVSTSWQLEEIQARYFLHVLSAWHGTFHQRENTRRAYGTVIAKAQEAGLFSPFTPSNPGAAGFSIYHQVGDHQSSSPTDWDWASWVEQERRNRVMFGILLLDTAYAIFFNHPPRVNLHDVRLTLPSDDASWDALDAEECANALGLNGEGPNNKNITGSRRVQQPEFMATVTALLEPSQEFKPGTTNAYSKFILVHALHSHIWVTQQRLPNATEMGIGQAIGSMTNPSLEWKNEGGVLSANGGSSERGTPEGFIDNTLIGCQQRPNTLSEAARAVRICQYSLEKWKKAWETDLHSQFPLPTARVGFGRDGLPFYWLAKLYLARNRTTEWRHGIDDDRTVARVKNMLKHVRGFIADDTGRLDLQGAVSAIDDGYAMDELTYDMKLLFRPIGTDSSPS
ncbi:putative Zinc finger, C2H2 type transcription factor [Tuber indicum]|nr:putative Zinc finger, C2H2 type transcription factor [Tuber indicum]